MNFPAFPTQSLYGSFPSFPTYTFGWHLPSWMGGYGFSVSLPNLTGIPDWIAEIFAYALGWVAAFFLWIVEVIVYGISVPLNDLINYASAGINWTFQAIEQISGQAGVFGPIVAALLGGALLLVIILGVFAFISLLSKLGGAAE